MLYKIRHAMIVSDDKDFAERCVRICKANDIFPYVVSEQQEDMHMAQDIILCDCMCLYTVRREYARKTVVVLDDEHSYHQYSKEYDMYIFNRNNDDEIEHILLYKHGEERIARNKRTVSSVLSVAGNTTFDGLDCLFDFAQGRYMYKGEQVFFTEAQKVALARILLLGEKSQYTRVSLCRLRKQFGDGFLRGGTA